MPPAAGGVRPGFQRARAGVTGTVPGAGAEQEGEAEAVIYCCWSGLLPAASCARR